ncbi:tRNA 2-thiouridine(34) synthase MnmA, partial [Patescibacteria group bacterium]|nr:tRNA 2-thiouridine(34) synthase MnmA [Patescibacteria group bacterium]
MTIGQISRGKKKKKGKVLVAMSGGVDSSVVAALLKKDGYECIGVYMNFWTDPTAFEANQLAQFPQNKCCSLESANMARRIAGELDMPFYILNASEKFKKKVVDDFVDTYAVCQTPNPCVQCNKHIKFGFLLDRMKQLGADFVATGHFARVKKKKKKGKNVWELYMGKDEVKDQSYFLYTLTQEKLKHVLFPVGAMTKKKVKKLAEKFGFHEVAKKRESQGICFFPDKKHSDFLKRVSSTE